MIGLVDLVRTGAKIDVIARHLDELDAETRARETRMLGGREQQQLYAIAADSPPLRLTDFVPEDAGDLQQVVHFGRNSQPLFKYFEKRWCRPSGEHARLFGYNETPVRRLIGPGYFVAHATADGGSDPRGAIVVDYFMTPDGAVAQGWPDVRPNSQGLQRFVYGQTRDYMRRVSAHVTIGEAQRKESRVMGWFVLCREP